MAAVPRISVIIPSFDGKHLLGPCLDGVLAQTYPASEFEIIVVDNGSTDGTAEWLTETYPHVVVVRETSNLGFAEGTNRGVSVARGDWLLFLNNDTVPSPRLLAELFEATALHPAASSFAARILNWDDATHVEFGGSGLSVFGLGFQRSSLEADFVEAADGDAIPFACACAMLIRADTFREVGGFDRDYFAYYEDVDLGWRLWMTGRSTVYVPGAEVRHRRYGTARHWSARDRHFYWYRNSLMTLVKNCEDLPKLLPYALCIALQRISTLFQSGAEANANNDQTVAQSMFTSAFGASEGLNWVLTHWPEVLDKRRSVQSLRTAPDRHFAKQIGLSVDVGTETGAAENALALQLLPFMDLGALMTGQQIESAAVEAAARLAGEAGRAREFSSQADSLKRQLHARNLDLDHLRRMLHERNVDLNERNLDLQTAHRDLHDRNVAVETLRHQLQQTSEQLHQRNLTVETLNQDLHERNLETLRLHSDLHQRNLEAERLRAESRAQTLELEAARARVSELDSRLREILDSRSWKWTGWLRTLLRVRR